MTNNCLNCPSYLTPSEASAFFMKNTGAAMCARFGKPIGNSRSSKSELEASGEAIGRTCPKWGEPKPFKPDWSQATFAVALPDPTVIQFNRRRSQETVRACNTCEHFVREDVVATELGYSVGMCSAKGKLLLSNRYTFEARDCTERSAALDGVRTDVSGIMMLPEYTIGSKQSVDAVTAHAQAMANFVDPTEYPTDREVTPKQHENGIRAWRKIADSGSDRFTYLPIYRRDYFTEAEQKKIPSTGDSEYPEDYIDHSFNVFKVAVLWMELDETPGFWGQAGAGKTEFFRHLAWIMQLPFERFSITGSTELDDLAGKMHYSPDRGTYWIDGRLVAAWSKPCVMVVDEPNAGPPDVWQFLRPMTDNSKQLVIDASDDARPRDRHDNCYLGLAMNPAWDAKNAGVHQVTDADANRLMHIWLALPPPALEKEIIVKRCKHDGYDIPLEILGTIMSIAEDIRAACTEDTLPITWAIRPQLKVARASAWFDLTTCYKMAIADFLEPEAQEAVMNIVDTHIE